MKKFFSFFLLLLVAFIGQGHEFWLQPGKYRYQVGEELKFDFRVGENFMGEHWDLARHKVEKLKYYVAGLDAKDITAMVKPVKGSSVAVKFQQEGTCLVAMQSNAASIELDAEKFNAYLKEDGLDYILEARKKNNTLDKGAKEFYRRFAKLLVQAGNITDDTYKRSAVHTLEIIPLQNPYDLKTGDYLDCQVLLRTKPRPHVLVKVWSFVGNRVFLQNIYTEDDGTIRFPISSSGPWMVSTVHMEPSKIAGADYESLWASLVFGIE